MLDEDDDRLLPSNSLEATSLIVTPDKNNSVMTTTTRNIAPNSLGYTSSTSEETCNICKRLLYAFEEILRCRVCYGKYHWRCVKPQRVSRYGQNHDYICGNCNDSTAINLSHRSSNGNNITESFDTNDRDFVNETSRTNSTETNPENNIRNYEDKQPEKTRKITELDDYLPSQTNEEEYNLENSQYNDDSRATQRIQQQQQQNGIESDDEDDDRSTMFQADYEYTPLKEYAAMRNNRTTNDNNTNSYQNSPTDSIDHQPTSRYGGGLHYTNHGYDPTVTRLVEVPSMSSTNLASPTADSLPTNNRQTHFISTTNLNIKEKLSHRQQQQQQSNSPVHSTSYSPPNRPNDAPIFRSISQHQTDRHSTVENDSGIVAVSSSFQQQKQVDENQIVEKKLTNLVQQLGKQLENDAQKLNDKLEIKLKDLENMIHQQTYVIRRQDEVIERLKSQIHQIETERDHFRNRLSIHEQNETKKPITKKEPETFSKQDSIREQQNEQSNIKHSNTPTIITTDNNKPSTKKAPAPRVDTQRSIVNNEHEPTVAKFVRTIPTSRNRIESDSSSNSSVTGKLVSSVPRAEAPAASSRLDTIIHQSNTKDIINPSSSSNYSLAQIRRQGRPQTFERVSIEQQIITSVHHDDSDDDDENNKDDVNNNNNNNVLKPNRPISSSSSSSSPSLTTQSAKTNNTTTASRNPNKYPSFESLQHTYQSEQNPKLSTKTTSLQFGVKPVHDDEPGSIYMTPPESNRPAIQLNCAVKGWLRKQNRESFLKRIERYFCVLRNNALLMYRHDFDQTPHKAINLKGAKVLYYDDLKYGPSLELTWSNPSNDPKHYHLYAPNPQEADQWLTGIKTAILNLDNKTNWQQYRMNT